MLSLRSPLSCELWRGRRRGQRIYLPIADQSSTYPPSLMPPTFCLMYQHISNPSLETAQWPLLETHFSSIVRSTLSGILVAARYCISYQSYTYTHPPLIVAPSLLSRRFPLLPTLAAHNLSPKTLLASFLHSHPIFDYPPTRLDLPLDPSFPSPPIMWRETAQFQFLTVTSQAPGNGENNLLSDPVQPLAHGIKTPGSDASSATEDIHSKLSGITQELEDDVLAGDGRPSRVTRRYIGLRNP
ncbi:hypothetical protein CPB83DRAFT_605288 [Crepidotus variabilis]|uniref:Uncharacterized protein n=1 Tax=Crepidotus variabilis TaxID=179855 RepID=A0A9P6JLB6_9AGAR|nr:hypothetical protein CPB83DRAFT_605288 [Crepidotus variabilis]